MACAAAQPSGDAMVVSWRNPQGPRQGQQVHLDTSTGQEVTATPIRRTEGGRHFMSFHYRLHAGTWGYWLVGWISMAMLVALVSGVVVHRRIFADFFTFRPGKGQRSWLDAHNASAVLSLPFLFMIVYTGLAIFYTSYMPLPLQASYASQVPAEQAYTRFQSELKPQAPLRRSAAGTPAPLQDLATLGIKAAEQMQSPIRLLSVENPGDANALVRVLGKTPDSSQSRQLLNPAASAVLDGTSGVLLQLNNAASHDSFHSEQVHSVLEQLHFASFGGWPMKWFYFICGWIGTAMVATGTLLFTVKRRRKSEQEFGNATAAIYHWIEALNVTALAGTVIASIVFFYANRLISPDLVTRADWEIRLYFAAWLVSLVHARLRTPTQAWQEQLALAAVLCIGLPFINVFSTGQHLGLYLAHGDGVRAAVEITSVVLGLLLGYMAYRVRHQSRVRSNASALPRRAA